MAKLLQGILGGLSGSIGTVVGSSWKGIPVVKTKPLSVANPKTAAQTAQRSKFSFVVAFATVILAAVIKPLWDRFAIKQSGYNAFVQANIDVFNNLGLATPANLVISKGKMEATEMTAPYGNAGQQGVGCEWVNDAGSGYKLATDTAYFVAYNETNGEICFNAGEADRSDVDVSAAFASNLQAGDVIHQWLAFRRADGTIVSNTSYLTRVIA